MDGRTDKPTDGQTRIRWTVQQDGGSVTRDVLRTLSNIYDVVLFENSEQFLAFNYYRKKLNYRFLTGS